MAARHVAEMDADLQLGPESRIWAKPMNERLRRSRRATITVSRDSQGRHQFAARVAIMQSLLARGGWIDEEAIDAAADPPGVVLDDLPLGLGRGDLLVRRGPDVAVHASHFLCVHSSSSSGSWSSI